MNKNWLLALLLIGSWASAANKYRSFKELAAENTEGVDYKMTSEHHGSRVAVLAIHGGNIETGSSEVAREIAKKEHNLYLFEAVRKNNVWDLHITSHEFDEPKALKMTSNSRLCVSMHGYSDTTKQAVCLGGLNAQLKSLVFSELLKTKLLQQSNDNPCNEFHGVNPKNIVNRCQQQGVQIEMSKKLRDLLVKDGPRRQLFANAVRNAVSQYKKAKDKTDKTPLKKTEPPSALTGLRDSD